MISALICLLCKEWKNTFTVLEFISALFQIIDSVLFVRPQPRIASQTVKEKERERGRERAKIVTPYVHFLTCCK